MRKYLLASALALSLSVAQAGIITDVDGNTLSEPPAGISLELGPPFSVLIGTGIGGTDLDITGAFALWGPGDWDIEVAAVSQSVGGSSVLGTGVVPVITIDMSAYAAGTYPVTFMYTPVLGAPGSGAELLVTVVPEPHEYAMLAGLGLFGFAAYRRMRA